MRHHNTARAHAAANATAACEEGAAEARHAPPPSPELAQWAPGAQRARGFGDLSLRARAPPQALVAILRDDEDIDAERLCAAAPPSPPPPR